jgi:hypothetical protein
MDDSFGFLTGSPESIKIQYEYLSDLMRFSRKGTWFSISFDGSNIQLNVYYEVPEGKREEVKQKFNNFIIIQH